ncbi:hypothetical protein [Nostoc sp.]
MLDTSGRQIIAIAISLHSLYILGRKVVSVITPLFKYLLASKI